MSTSPDSFDEKESQHNNVPPQEPAALEGRQTNEQTDEKGSEGQRVGEPTTLDSDHPELPPEAQGEANGGPLGCCLGVTVGLLLSLSIAVLSRFYADPLAQIFSSSLSLIVRAVMVLIAVIAVIVCGYFGWKIGKNAYREYDPPVLKGRRRKKTKSAARPQRAS